MYAFTLSTLRPPRVITTDPQATATWDPEEAIVVGVLSYVAIVSCLYTYSSRLRGT